MKLILSARERETIETGCRFSLLDKKIERELKNIVFQIYAFC